VGRDFADKCYGDFSPGAVLDERNISVGFFLINNIL
jgi:hypothetical protein